MRVLIVGSVLVLIAGAAMAQTSRPAPRKPAAAPEAKATTDALASCIAMWDRATHMSRREWNRACRRVADRIQNLAVK